MQELWERTRRRREDDAEAKKRLGEALGGWLIESALRRGPVCKSWVAVRGADQGVARVLLDRFANDAAARTEWLRATWAANRFRHRGIVHVIDQWVDQRGAPVVVRGWVPGAPLDEAAAGAGLDPTFALRVAEQVLDALEIAHAHGVVHGALSPSNVIVTLSRSVRVVDFAAPPALFAQREAERALAVARVGPYTAPERRVPAPAPPSEASDVWSVGACLYFAIVGAPPGEGLGRSPRLDAAGQEVVEVVERALSPEPDGRYPSAYAMLGDVRRLLAGRRPKLQSAGAPVPSQSDIGRLSAPPSSPRSEPPAAAPDPPRPRRSEWRGNTLLMLAIAMLVGLATFVMMRERLADPSARSASPALP